MGRTRLRGFEWAGCRIAIEDGSGWDWAWPSGWEDHACSAAGADVHISVAVADPPGSLPDALSYHHEGAIVDAALAGGDPLFTCDDGRVARFDRGFEWGAVTLPTSLARASTFPLTRPLDDLVVIHRAMVAGALAVRATASVRDGQALVVLGDETLEDASVRSTTWAGWLMLEPEHDGVRVSRLPSTRVSGSCSDDTARLSGLHLVESLPESSPAAAVLDSGTGAAEILRFAFAPLFSAIPIDRAVETASRLAERSAIVRLAACGVTRFGWQRVRPPLSFAPPAGA